MGALTLRVAGLSALALLMSACAQDPGSNQPAAPTGFTVPEGVLVSLDEQVLMRDGARLNTDVYLPNEGETPVAAILIRTPYETELRARHHELLKRGYAIVEQHERGRYPSEGAFTMIPQKCAPCRADSTVGWLAVTL